MVFSTDSDSKRNKTKCMFYTRKSQNSTVYPTPVKLDGTNLPWVERTDHLDYVLNQSCSLLADTLGPVSTNNFIRILYQVACPGETMKGPENWGVV